MLSLNTAMTSIIWKRQNSVRSPLQPSVTVIFDLFPSGNIFAVDLLASQGWCIRSSHLQPFHGFVHSVSRIPTCDQAQSPIQILNGHRNSLMTLSKIDSGPKETVARSRPGVFDVFSPNSGTLMIMRKTSPSMSCGSAPP